MSNPDIGAASPNKSPEKPLERRIALILLVTMAPLFAVSLGILWWSQASTLAVVTLTALLVVCIATGLVVIQRLLSRQFSGVTNVLESLRNGDFTAQLSPSEKDSAWGDLQAEVNQIARRFHESRISRVESDIILDKLIDEFDIPLLVIDRGDAINNINQAGLSLFHRDRAEIIGLRYQQLHLQPLVEAPAGTLVEFTFPKRGGRWEVRRNVVRKDGSRLTLLLLNDLSRALREEERKAWQRMIRVISHELNNSLSSITSIAETLATKTDSLNVETLEKGMGIIAERGHGLMKFTESYTRLAKLPEPHLGPVALSAMMDKCCALVEGDFECTSEELQLIADAEQLQQLFINLLKNAQEASPNGAVVKVAWKPRYHGVQVDIVDSGEGITNQDNLFVPFYTTKPEGNGIGLFLCKQIAENHKGTLTLMNRSGEKGCIASLWLPRL